MTRSTRAVLSLVSLIACTASAARESRTGCAGARDRIRAQRTAFERAQAAVGARARAESTVELTYLAQLTSWLSLQPDLQ